ncbi:ABC-F family ATP-binding cassette domain-containing protein [Glaciecola sp. MH2013]|uniref:ATP-binding cassette domain-containing protein n=1 Tax=Glaciecola sp. MH2013 TaxID=2785524 RepID=UPI00189C7DDF|nr:ATP-binding cassette domain-containing protein [Glaciecola sp. MH2013]MBF7073632.1 ABC-F family ATP-binding cassette domain-containing protein [Glaciecola sp. MH2013]
MAHLHIQKLSYSHHSGENLFKDLHFTLPNGRTALVGRNGVGKSLLISLIKHSALCGDSDNKAQETLSSGQMTGSIDCSVLPRILEQRVIAKDTIENSNQTSLAEVFGVANKLKALKAIEKGSIDPAHFELVGDDWALQEQLNALIGDDNIQLNDPVSRFSGGELMKLSLIKLFSELDKNDILILDEPSNHLDLETKHWLVNKVMQLPCKTMIVSHDKLLLDTCDQVAELSANEIKLFTGNFDAYLEHSLQQKAAAERHLHQLDTQKKTALKQAQRDKEKAQKRASRGEKSAAKGGLPRVVANARSSKSESSAAKTKAQHEAKQRQLSVELSALKPKSKDSEICFRFSETTDKKRCLLKLDTFQNGHMSQAISIAVYHGEHWYLPGKNGSGKSSFLKSIAKNKNTLYIDQNCSFMNSDYSLLEVLSQSLPESSELSFRTLLAGNGFKGEHVHKKVDMLSGGEKMRLAMLIASSSTNSLLLLDEPDNHLDFVSKGLLARALSVFTGAYILVSHDEYFVGQCGVSNTCDALASDAGN